MPLSTRHFFSCAHTQKLNKATIWSKKCTIEVKKKKITLFIVIFKLCMKT